MQNVNDAVCLQPWQIGSLGTVTKFYMAENYLF